MPRDIPLPRLPEPPQPYAFPVLATLAPVIAALGMWGVTRSPFALMFAVLGPLVAIGSLVDSRLQGRRRRRRELMRFETDAAATRIRIEREHERLRASLWLASRSAGRLVPAALHDAERWRHAGGELPVVIGVGERASGLRLTGADASDADLVAHELGASVPARRAGRSRRRADSDAAAMVARSILELRRQAAVLQGAPITIDARLGIGICGARVPALALARSVVVQLADALSPGDVEARGSIEEWHGVLPHAVPAQGRQRGARLDFVTAARAGGDAPAIPVVVAEHPDALPRECRIGIEVSGGEVRMLRHPLLGVLDADGVAVVPRRCRADFVSALDARRFAATLASAAEAEGLLRRGGDVPGSARLSTVWDAVPARTGLGAAFAVDGAGAVAVDLVADGPHAIVGGTTGSGKSELLIAWVLAMARAASPEQVTFLLVDFKGGSSFGEVAALPHSVGLITDLDQGSAVRALESLAAELRHRERVLAEQAARAIDDLAPGVLPRLVVVVDEFAAMVADFPDLHALFADIAARGRSLGVHLILCTQRPAGVVRDSVMANCTLRLSLRVNNRHDSIAVIGTDAAAALPRAPVGRCLLSVAGGEPRLTQVARAVEGDAVLVAQGWAGSPPPRRPWLPSLPTTLPWEQVLVARSDGSGIRFGLLDLPQEQRQPAAAWRPSDDGHILVVGGQGSGKSTTLAALSRGARGQGVDVLRLARDLEAAWDALVRLVSREPSTASRPLLVMIDDLDALTSRFADHHSAAFLDIMTVLLREGPAAGVHVAASVQRLTATVQSLAGLFDSRLLLRLPSRQEHLLAGGEGAQHLAGATPGRGRWRGAEVQVALAECGAERDAQGGSTRRAVDVAADGVAAVVTARPAAMVRLIESLGGDVRACSPAEALGRLAAKGAVVAVGDPQAWQASWSALAALRQHGAVIFDRCTPGEFRLVSGLTALPPPLSRAPGGAWLVSPEGEIVRVQLPATPQLVDKFND